MVADIRVTGGEKFQRLARDLKAAGEQGKGLRRELFKELNAAGKPLAAEVRAAELANLPRGGGYAELVASERIAISKTGGKNAGIRLRQMGKTVRALKQMDAGRLRHPVFGNRKTWAAQAIKPGTWTDTLTGSETTRQVRKAFLKAMETTARKLKR